MAGMGLFGLGFSEDVGGQGFGKLGYCVAVEQLARANASLWNVIGGSAGLCGTAIDIGGPDELRERYLPELLSARKIGAYGLSEPGAGSDAGGWKTTARRARRGSPRSRSTAGRRVSRSGRTTRRWVCTGRRPRSSTSMRCASPRR